MEVATWDGPNIHRTSSRLGLRSEACGRFEKGLAPEQALEAQAVATELMVELCGATVGRRHDRRRAVAAEPWPHATIRLREARVAALLGIDIPRARQEQPDRARLRRAGATPDGLDVTVPALPAQRRHARGRPRRGGRALRRSTSCPATLPKRRGAAGRLSAAAAAAPPRASTRSSAAARYEIVGWSFTEPGVADRLRLPPDDPRRAVRRAREPDERGPVGPAHDAARLAARRRRATTSRAATRDLRLFEQGAVYLAARRRAAAARAPRARRRAARPPRARRRGAPAARPRPRTSSPPRACSRPCSTRCASTWSVARRRPSRSCTRAAARRSLAGDARSSAGSASCTRWSRAPGTSTGRSPRSSSTSTPWSRTPSRSRTSRTSPPSRRSARTSPSSWADDVAGAGRGRRGPRAPAASCSPTREVFDVYRGAQVGDGRKSLALRARRSARRPDADRRGRRAACARRSSRRCGESVGGELRG